MKKVICVMLVVILIVMLCGCGRKVGEEFTNSGRFVIVSGDNNLNAPYYETIIVDNNTGVMYLVLYSYYHFGITPLLNADGTPMLIKEGTGGLGE